jgi:hypothetical protein
MQSFKPALIGACGLVALVAWSQADAQTVARAGDPSCAPILNAMKKQAALPVFGAASTLDDGPERELIVTQTDVFTASGNGRWSKKPKSPEQRDQDQWLAKYSSQLHACSTGVPDTLNGAAATLYAAQLGTVLIREWVGQANGLPMQQEGGLPGVHKRVTVWNYDVAIPASDKIDPE